MKTGTFTIFTPSSILSICLLRPDLQNYTVYRTDVENSTYPEVTVRTYNYQVDVSMISSTQYMCRFFYCY